MSNKPLIKIAIHSIFGSTRFGKLKTKLDCPMSDVHRNCPFAQYPSKHVSKQRINFIFHSLCLGIFRNLPKVFNTGCACC